jgi:hypothetical protein
MKSIKKILFIYGICVSFFSANYAAEVPWLPATTYTIPDDTNTYTLDWTFTLTDDLTLSGTLDIKLDGILSTSDNIIENDNTIDINGLLHIAGWPAASDFGRMRNANSASSTAYINVLTGGTLLINSYLRNGFGSSSVGLVNLSGGTITADADTPRDLINGYGSSSTGIINIDSGNYNNYHQTLINGGNSTSTGNLNLNGGTFNQLDSNSFLRSAGEAGTTAIINIAGGTLNFSSGQMNNGQFGDATINITSGTFNLNRNLISGNTNTSGDINLSGGIINMPDIDAELYLASSNGSVSTFNMTGGTINLNSSAKIINGGPWGAGTANFIQSGGTINFVSGSFNNGGGPGATGNFTISGGTFDMDSGSSFRNFSDPSAAAATLTINNVGALTSNGYFENLGSGQIFIHDSGALIHDNGVFINDTVLANIFISGNGTLTNNADFENNGNIIVIPNGQFINNGTLYGSGIIFDAATENLVIEENLTITIPSGLTLAIQDYQTLNINGELKILSDSSLDVLGTVYTYSYIVNGDGSNPGTVNINHPGTLFLLGGTLENGNSSSVVNVNQGGSLYNYHGELDTTLGNVSFNSGGYFNNIPGAFNGSIVKNGGLFRENKEINLEKNLNIDYTWTLTEVSVINGYGNKITLGAGGAIVIEKDASLMLRDVTINDVSGNKIRCTDNNSTLSIHNVIWTQDSNFSCTKGQIHVSGDWLIQGKNTEFSFESDQEIAVTSDATIHMLMTTFNFNSDTPTLLNLSNNTSTIHLEHATLLASKACTLANGTIQITGLGTFQGDSTLNLQSLDSIDIAGGLRRVGAVVI